MLTYEAGVSDLLQLLFEYKQKTLVTLEIRKMIQLKTQTPRRQSRKLCLETKICRLCGDMTKFGGYSIGIAQIHEEIKEKRNSQICPNSTIRLLVSRSDRPNMRSFSIGGIKNQHDAILESFGTIEEIIISFLAYRQQLPLFFPLLSPTHLNSPRLFAPLNLRNYSKSNFDSAAKSPLLKLF